MFKSHYEELLGQFSNYLVTLEANAQNYERELQQIQQQLPEDDLNFLTSFSQNYRLFQAQIQLEIGYFQATGKPIEKALEAIRGRLETEQAERDRSLEITIQVLGVGLGTTAIVSSVIGAYKDIPYTINLKKPIHPTVTTLFWSLIIGAIAGVITWLIVRPRHRSSKYSAARRERGTGNGK